MLIIFNLLVDAPTIAIADKIARKTYDVGYDFNVHGYVNAADVQILARNYGFRANNAPVVTPTLTSVMV